MTIKNNISTGEKTQIVIQVSEFVVSKDLGYVSTLFEPIFNFCIISKFTDIKLSDDLDEVQKFVAENKKLMRKLKRLKAVKELRKACDNAIDHRVLHIHNNADVRELTAAVNELIEKPDITDVVSEFLNKITDFKIDETAVNKLVDLVPVLNNVANRI